MKYELLERCTVRRKWYHETSSGLHVGRMYTILDMPMQPWMTCSTTSGQVQTGRLRRKLAAPNPMRLPTALFQQAHRACTVK